MNARRLGWQRIRGDCQSNAQSTSWEDLTLRNTGTLRHLPASCRRGLISLVELTTTTRRHNGEERGRTLLRCIFLWPRGCEPHEGCELLQFSLSFRAESSLPEKTICCVRKFSEFFAAPGRFGGRRKVRVFWAILPQAFLDLGVHLGHLDPVLGQGGTEFWKF